MKKITVSGKVAKHVIIIAVLAIIPMLWYGDRLISNIGLDLQVTPRALLEDVFFGWQSRSSLGTSFIGSGWVFPSATFFTILSAAGLPGFVIVRCWYVLILFLAGICMYVYVLSLLTNHFPCEGLTNKHEQVGYRAKCALVGAIGYMANPYVVMHFDNGHFLIPYAILPLQLLIVEKGLRSGNLYFAPLLALTAVLVTTNPPIVLINYVVIAMFILWYIMWIDGQNMAKKMMFVVASFSLVGLNLLWFFVPTLLLLLSNDPTLSGAMAAESWQMYGMHSSFSETLRLLGIWGLYASGNDYAEYFH